MQQRASSRTLGALGEKLAGDFLIRKGFHIIDRHITTRYGEIDIIAQDAGELVFVEVKTRRSFRYGSPEESIPGKKLKSLRLAIEAYMQKQPDNRAYRLDCVFITFSGSVPAIHHLPGCG